jgi:hypothetical protein
MIRGSATQSHRPKGHCEHDRGLAVRIYTAMMKHDAEPVLVREGFSWGAFLFGPIWLALHRAWIAAIISLALYIVVGLLITPPARGFLITAEAFLLGLLGHDLRRWALESRGYLLLHVLRGRDWDDAWVRLLRRRPDLAERFRPEVR